MFKKLIGGIVTITLLLSAVDAQLSPQVQQHLKKLANSEVQKQLVNGSDNKNVDLSE